MLGSLLILSGAPSHPRLTDPSELNKNTVSYQAPSLWRLLRFAHGALHVSFKDLCGARGVQFCSVLHERTALDSRFTDDPLNVGHSLDSQAGCAQVLGWVVHKSLCGAKAVSHTRPVECLHPWTLVYSYTVYNKLNQVDNYNTSLKRSAAPWHIHKRITPKLRYTVTSTPSFGRFDLRRGCGVRPARSARFLRSCPKRPLEQGKNTKSREKAMQKPTSQTTTPRPKRLAIVVQAKCKVWANGTLRKLVQFWASGCPRICSSTPQSAKELCDRINSCV